MTWADIPMPPGIPVALGDGARLVATDGDVVVASRDGGRSWSDTLLDASHSHGAPANLPDPLRLHRLGDSVLYAGSDTQGHLSLDAGSHWTSVPPVRARKQGVLAANGDTVYALDCPVGPTSATDASLLRLEARRWVPVKRFPRNCSGGQTANLQVLHGTFWITIGHTTLRSRVPESAWSPVTLPHAADSSGAIVPTRRALLLADEHGVYRSADEGETWNASSTGIPASLTAVLPTPSGLIVLATDRAYEMTPGQPQWRELTEVNDAIAGDSALRESGPGPLLVAAQTGDTTYVIAGRTLLRRIHEGAFRPVVTLPHVIDSHAVDLLLVARGPMLLGGVMGSDLHGGSYFVGFATSRDGGLTWRSPDEESLADTVAPLTTSSFDTLAALLIHDGVIYAASARGISASTDGSTWHVVGTGLDGLPVTTAVQVADRFMVAGMRSGNLALLDRTRRDVQWSRVAANGLRGDVNGVWRDPRHPAFLVATTDVGIFESTDEGASFQAVHMADRSARDSLDTGTVLGLAEYRDTLMAISSRGLLRIDRRDSRP